MKSFDKEQFAQILSKAKGVRSINQFGNACDVDPGYLSRLLRGLLENPPSPTILSKIALHAENGVRYEDLMQAAGILPVNEEVPQQEFIPNSNMHELLKEMNAFFRMQTNLSDEEKQSFIQDMREYFRFKAEQTKHKK
jgi:transcriptional regulator with XRE-family HTH domain